MGTTRTAWHPLFVSLLTERAPPSFEVRSEVLLSSEPQRADVLLLRRHGARELDAHAQVLRELWPTIEREAILEFKSRARPLRRHDLSRLLGYGWQHFAGRSRALFRPHHLRLILVVPTVTPTLHKEVARLRLAPLRFERGYATLTPMTFPAAVVSLDAVATAEKDDLLALFARAKLQTPAGQRWLGEHGMNTEPSELRHLEGFDEIKRVFLASVTPEERLAGLAPEERLAGLAPEQRLAGLAPEQRLAGLTPAEYLLALPLDALRALDPAYLDTLPGHVREAIRQRLALR